MMAPLASRSGQALVAAMILLGLFAGCAAGQTGLRETNSRIRVFGVELGSTGTPREIRGVAATEEPCLKGCERSFDTLAISIGYGHDGRIRRITTRNPDTSLFGIIPGDGFGASRPKALLAGFRETAVGHRFLSAGCSLMLLVDEGGRVFGMTLELQD